MIKNTKLFHSVSLKEYRRLFIKAGKGLTEKEQTIRKWYTEFITYAAKNYYDNSKRVIGRISFFVNKQCPKFRAIAIGISIREKYRNKGYATMMIRRTTKFLENSKKYKLLYAYIMHANEYGEYSKKAFLSNGYKKSVSDSDCSYYNKTLNPDN